ncbi:MAG TPA: formate/nitrite transporter family protein [Ktedonobacterales bacterium]|jgi:formate/nitrite transporter FocA (FNT family)|nr:formate/nitrite transporter family protein [Ktedonobacterales bacterium]
MAHEDRSDSAQGHDASHDHEAALEESQKQGQNGTDGTDGQSQNANARRTGSPQASDALQSAFHNTLQEGEERLGRSLPALLATGLVGGIDVGTGVLGLLLVLTLTGSEVGGALAFGIGFIALGLGNSELFTENFLVPIAPIVARRAGIPSLLRLWLGTLVMNLIGGWIITLIVITALPETRPVAITLGEHFVKGGVTLTSFASAVLGGVVITLMTWMERNTESVISRVVASEAAAFLLAAGHLNHAIVASLEMFAALHAGATFGYLTWFGLLGWAVLGNVIGGVLFVTVLRLVQVGAHTIKAESHRAREERPDVEL